MKYSEREVSALYEEDFTQPFMGTFGSDGSDKDIFTIVLHPISYYKVEKIKNVFEILPDLYTNLVHNEFVKYIKIRSHRDKDLWDISQLEKLRNSKK